LEKLSSDRLGEPSADIRARVEKARARQRARFEGTTLTCNADTPALAPERSAGTSVGPAEVRQHCQVDPAGKSLLRAATPVLAAPVQVCSSCT
jgi:magnesium chelatase family protein